MKLRRISAAKAAIAASAAIAVVAAATALAATAREQAQRPQPSRSGGAVGLAPPLTAADLAVTTCAAAPPPPADLAVTTCAVPRTRSAGHCRDRLSDRLARVLLDERERLGQEAGDCGHRRYGCLLAVLYGAQ